MAARDLRLFEHVFRDLFKPLCGFAMKYLHDFDASKEVVHDVFLTVWEKMETLPPDVHYRSYLYTAVKNRCLNQIRDRKKLVPLDNLAVEQLPRTAALIP